MIRRRLKLDEGNISEIGYDGEDWTMAVVFRDVPEYVYEYKNISPAVFCQLINAESTGSFFAKSIRPHTEQFPFTKSLTNQKLTKE